MFIATCLILLFLSLCMLFIILMVWLARILEGYPVLLMSNASRDASPTLEGAKRFGYIQHTCKKSVDPSAAGSVDSVNRHPKCLR